MNSKKITTVALLAAFVALGVAVLFLKSRKETAELPPNSIAQDDAANMAQAEAKRLAEAQETDASKGTVPPPSSANNAHSAAALSYGELKPVAADASPQVESATEAALTKTHPERLTCAILPAPFDAAKWKDPAWRAAYLATPEPARCYQSAQPGQGVKRLALACPAYIETLQGQPVELRVKAIAGMPVTFTSFDAAMFIAGSGNTGSQLTTQTVVADESGIATATLVATPGVIDNCRVIASSPVMSGLVKINVFAKLPKLQAPAATPLAVTPASNP